MSLCLIGGGVAISIAVQSFSLTWTHTVEKVEWREDWRVEHGRLVLDTARVKGSGAGMDPPAEARIEQGFYVWEPGIKRAEIIVRRDPHAGDWRLCAAGRCDDIGAWISPAADPVRIYSAAGSDCGAKKPASPSG